MKACYQVDLTLTGWGSQQVHGIDLASSNVPAKVAYDLTLSALYWHDDEFSGRNSIKRMSFTGDSYSEHSLTTLAHGTTTSSCSSCSSRVLYWHDDEFSGRNSIKRMSFTGDSYSEHSLSTLAHGTTTSSCIVVVVVVVVVVVCSTGMTTSSVVVTASR